MTTLLPTSVVAVVGLGYVGPPLAVAFGRVLPTIGYDHNTAMIRLYQSHHDLTGEVTAVKFAAAVHLAFSNDHAALALIDLIVVAVLTLIDEAQNPDLRLLLDVTRIGKLRGHPKTGLREGKGRADYLQNVSVVV